MSVGAVGSLPTYAQEEYDNRRSPGKSHRKSEENRTKIEKSKHSNKDKKSVKINGKMDHDIKSDLEVHQRQSITHQEKKQNELELQKYQGYNGIKDLKQNHEIKHYDILLEGEKTGEIRSSKLQANADVMAINKPKLEAEFHPSKRAKLP